MNLKVPFKITYWRAQIESLGGSIGCLSNDSIWALQ